MKYKICYASGQNLPYGPNQEPITSKFILLSPRNGKDYEMIFYGRNILCLYLVVMML